MFQQLGTQHLTLSLLSLRPSAPHPRGMSSRSPSRATPLWHLALQNELQDTNRFAVTHGPTCPLQHNTNPWCELVVCKSPCQGSRRKHGSETSRPLDRAPLPSWSGPSLCRTLPEGHAQQTQSSTRSVCFFTGHGAALSTDPSDTHLSTFFLSLTNKPLNFPGPRSPCTT